VYLDDKDSEEILKSSVDLSGDLTVSGEASRGEVLEREVGAKKSRPGSSEEHIQTKKSKSSSAEKPIYAKKSKPCSAEDLILAKKSTDIERCVDEEFPNLSILRFSFAPFLCPFCDMRFTSMDTTVAHVDIVHELLQLNAVAELDTSLFDVESVSLDISVVDSEVKEIRSPAQSPHSNNWFNELQASFQVCN
jgi:hypothetical protein